MNASEQIVYNQPTTTQERAEIAQAGVLRLNFVMPMALDHMSNAVDIAYSALPERLFLIDSQGRIDWHSDMGPWGFDVDGWEKAVGEIAAK